jgi:transmembrane 9 superfamily protein 2/4
MLCYARFVSALLYFGYMFVATIVFFLLTGTIGFYACVRY